MTYKEKVDLLISLEMRIKHQKEALHRAKVLVEGLDVELSSLQYMRDKVQDVKEAA